MAQQLDFSPLDQRAQIYRDKARRDEMNLRASEQVAKGIFDVVDWQQDMKQKFAEASEFDYDITLDAQANAYLANRYDQALKQPHIEAIMGKKWKNQDHVNKMLASQKQLEREATNVKGMVQARQQAEQAVVKNPNLYTMDEEAVKGFESFLMGKTDVKNGNAYLMGLQGNDGTPPFLKLAVHNIDDAIAPIAMKLRDDYSTIKTEITNEIQGRTDLTTTQKRKIIDEQAQIEFDNLVLGELLKENKSMMPGWGKDAEAKLAAKGIATSGPRDALTAYIQDFDYSPYFQERTVAETTAKKPVKEDSGASKISTVEKTDTGWKFGDSTVTITTDLPEGDAKVYQIVKKDGKYIAKAKVPSLNGEEIKEVMALVSKELNREPTQDELMDAMIKKRSKVVEIPLEDIYDELKRGFNKKKMKVAGFDEIEFGDIEAVKKEDSKDGYNTGGLY